MATCAGPYPTLSKVNKKNMSTTTAPICSQSLVGLMSDPSSYPEHPHSVQVIETHISWVFLTSEYAYKLKKPIVFEFLDFSTVERRHRACLDEVRLNRRLAPDVYLGVLPITQDSAGDIRLDGQGQPIDWLVQMRRLPASDALDRILCTDRLIAAHTLTIAKHLTSFYARLLPKSIGPDIYREALDRHIRANGAALVGSLPADESRVRRIQSAQLRYLHVNAELIGNRATSGRVVEGHGDMRPEHIYLDGHPTVIDCIEFSEELRTVDIADELSFLSMECERLGNGGLGKAVFAEYQRVSGDQVPESLLAFYRCYRATVRAKVALLRSQQATGNIAGADSQLVGAYVNMADRYAKQLGPPTLLIVGGPMGSGKSTLATKLAVSFDIKLLSTDHIRHRLIGSSAAPAAYGERNYRADLRCRVYDELFRQADEQLKDGQSVVLDGTFLTYSLRDRAYDLANRYGAVSLHVQCTCPRPIACARIEKRAETGRSESEARTELYDLQTHGLEPLCADEPAITIDTTSALPQQFRAVNKELKQMASS